MTLSRSLMHRVALECIDIVRRVIRGEVQAHDRELQKYVVGLLDQVVNTRETCPCGLGAIQELIRDSLNDVLMNSPGYHSITDDEFQADLDRLIRAVAAIESQEPFSNDRE